MALFEWTSTLTVNVAEIDKQHQKLIALINELHDAMAEGRGKEVLEKIIERLIAYAAEHFSTEENYFAKINYPGALGHKKEHSEFVKKVKEFQENFNKGQLALTLDVMHFLKDWLIKHIQGTDKKYSPYFNEKGIT